MQNIDLKYRQITLNIIAAINISTQGEQKVKATKGKTFFLLFSDIKYKNICKYFIEKDVFSSIFGWDGIDRIHIFVYGEYYISCYKLITLFGAFRVNKDFICI